MTVGSDPPTPAASYALTSANDFPERDPADFRLEGLLWSAPALPPTPSSHPSHPQAPAADVDHSQSHALAQGLGHDPSTTPSSQSSEAPVPMTDADSSQSDALPHDGRQQSAAGGSEMLQGLSISAEPGSKAAGSNGSCNGHSKCAELHVAPFTDAEPTASPAPAEHAGAHRKMGLGKKSEDPCSGPQLSAGATPHDASSQQPGSDCRGQAAPPGPGAGATADGKGRADEIPSPDTSQSDAMRPACQADSVEAASGVEGHKEGSGSAPAAGMGEWVVLDEQQGICFAHRHQRLMFTVKAPRACRCYTLPLTHYTPGTLCAHMPSLASASQFDVLEMLWTFRGDRHLLQQSH